MASPVKVHGGCRPRVIGTGRLALLPYVALRPRENLVDRIERLRENPSMVGAREGGVGDERT
jgi:hypothetical protein